MNNLYELLIQSENRYPNHTALIFNDQVISYTNLKEAVDRLSGGLQKQGFHAGDRIAIMLPNIPHFPIAYYAILEIGAVVVPIFTNCRNEEIHHQLEEAEVRGIIYWEGYRDDVIQIVRGLERCQKRMVLGEKATAGEIRLNYLMEISEPLPQYHVTEPDDTAVIVYTDRIKGRSKGVELTHANLAENVNACRQFLKVTEEDGTVGIIPFYHMVGQTLLMNLFLSAGARICLMTRFQSESVFKAVHHHRLTVLIAVPSIFETIVNDSRVDPADFASLRCCISTGDALSQATLDSFESKFKIIVQEGYGLTEASPMVSFNSSKSERKAGSIGLPLQGVEIKIVGENGDEILPGKIGEILVQGPNVMKGYLNRSEATKEALEGGWLHTGDLARVDDNGHAFVVARKRNVIMKGGFAIYPNEIEVFLNTHPKIGESVVVGLSDTVQGEEIHACVQLKSGESATQEEIIEFLKNHLPMYKCPKSILFVSVLPKGPTGRIIRDQIRQMFLEKVYPNP